MTHKPTPVLDAKRRVLPLLEEWLKANGWKKLRGRNPMPNSEWRRPKQVWRKQTRRDFKCRRYLEPHFNEYRCTLGHLGVTFEKLGLVPKYRPQLAWLTQTYGLYSKLRVEDGRIYGLQLAKRLVVPEYIKQ